MREAMSDSGLTRLAAVIESLDIIDRRGAWKADPGICACVIELREIYRALAPSADYARGLEDAARICDAYAKEAEANFVHEKMYAAQGCADTIRAKINAPEKGKP